MSFANIPIVRLLRYMKSYRKDYTLGTIYSICNKLFDIAPEILIGVAVDTVVNQKNSWIAKLGLVDVKAQLVALGVLTFLIWGFESVFEYLYALKWRNLAQRVQHHFRLDVYSHVQDLDMKTFEQKSTGNLLSILNDDVNQLERFLETGVNDILQVFCSSLIIGLVFFVVAPIIALFAVVPIPFILFGAFYFQNKLAGRFLSVREKAGLLGARLVNNISGIMTIKSFTAERFELEQIANDSNAYLEANRNAIALSAMINPVIRIAVLAGFMSTLLIGGFMTISGTLPVGIFSALVFLTQRLLWPLTRLADITINYQRAMASVTRILDLLQTPVQITSGSRLLESEQVKGSIVIENVKFAYEKHDVIKGISLTIPAGKSVAFVGASGGGKTTLVKLLLRFYLPTEGRILLDGVDIAEYQTESLRKATALVSQDVFLFHGSVAENIAYAMPDVDRAQVIEAAKQAEAHAFISEMPEGYDTIVGERGQKLSGGQRQRIAIARAILRDPHVLILDEATSAVDNETELAIQKSLEKIVQGRTTIMIAHRLSTIRNADTIFVLKNGQVVEEGNHETLLHQKGTYAALWHLQTGAHVDERKL